MKPRTLTLGLAVVASLLFSSIPAGAADSVPVTDLTPQLQTAGLDIDGLRALEIGGIVILRGTAVNRATAERAGMLAQNLGHTRVANLIRVAELPDDAAIERAAERQLARYPALDGCDFHVDSDRGILRVGGRVRYALQRDVALRVLRNIDGVREVQADFAQK